MNVLRQNSNHSSKDYVLLLVLLSVLGIRECVTGLHLISMSAIVCLTSAALVLSAVLAVSLYRSVSVARIMNTQIQIIQMLADPNDMEGSVSKALAVICATFQFKFGALWLIDESEKTISCSVSWQSESIIDRTFSEATKNTKFEKGIGLPGRVWQTEREHWIDNVQSDDNYPRAPFAREAGFKAGFCFPVFCGQKLVGVVEFYRDRVDGLDTKVVPVLSSFGQEFGQFVERAKSVRQIVLDSQIAKFTAEISAALTADFKDTREMLQQCTDIFVKHLPITFARIWITNPKENMLELQASSGMYTHINGSHSRIPVGRYKIGLIALEKAPHLTNALSTDSRVSDPAWVAREGVVAFVGYPLILEGEVLGVIGAFSKQVLAASVLESISSISHSIALGIRRRQMDLQLCESERLFRQLAENVQEVFFVKTAAGNYSYVSPVYDELWGQPRETLIQNPMAILNSISIRDREKVNAFIANAAESEQAGGIEFKVLRKDGTAKWVWMRNFPTFLDDGTPGEIYGIAHDITERKQAEKRVNEFFSTVSHELRTPLTSIHASLRLMEGGVVGPLSAKVQKLVGIARTESDRLIRLINDILDLRKLEAGKLELKCTTVEASAIVRLALHGMQGMAAEAGVKLEQRMQFDGPISCDQDRMIQVLENLISNAIKYSPKEGIVTISVAQQESTVRFSIEDQGPGIYADQINKLFEKFQQLDSSDSRPKGGTGLGLAITKAIIEQHGGHVGVCSTPGIGSKFWVELPITAAPESEVPSPEHFDEHREVVRSL